MMTERDNQEPSTRYHYTQQQETSTNDGTTVRTQAAFVNKLYKMLEDTSIQNLISWSERGDLFSVSNPTAFSKSVLPQYFKHNNWQSFVRQLNMYGFHKVNDMIHSNLTSDNQTWEFKHPHFKKGEIEDLQNIKRKSTKPSVSNLPARTPNHVRLQAENDEDIYGPMYKHILHIEERLHHVSRSYEILKNETNSLKGLLSKQQETISEFAGVLGDVLSDEANLSMNEVKRESILSKLSELQALFMNDNASQTSSTNSTQSLQQPYMMSSEQQQQQQQTQQEQQQTQTQTSKYYPSDILPPPNYSQQRFDPFIHTHSSYSPQSTSSPNTVSKNKRLGFGKESHLLNPEPHLAYPSSRDTKSSLAGK
ncbi:HSF-type DNA-binding-domain-containing protein [Gilbertella persicaria]|uniref:HSF-type DNA-binding-domain-containing protein n=1 Tax=Gilbertella persicaria TaxID=101096 RepID=UPI00221F6164|nr:HSF-type DNA-binding-domain-containing protein [Gilbertella persicaria]KAI8047849.1 HSF-type DNA-binding-domain-containing protein [Gilbertella persicaria]